MGVNYLVDFENVHEQGLYGMRSLAAEDCVYVFHTSGADRISLSCLDDVLAWVKVIPVRPGKQSLDMHLGSFLGYLIGREEDHETRYAVVSKDNGYRGVADFWNAACNRYDKVRCIQQIGVIPGTVIAKAVPAPPDPEEERRIIREFIIKAFSKRGVVDMNGLPCMLVSELCTMLNCLPEYNYARRRTDKKPMQFLEEEFGDVLLVRRQWQQDWAYLITGKQATGEETLPEEELPDIMEIGDLSIDGELPDSDESHEPVEAVVTAEAVPEEDKTEEPDFLAFALDCIREMTDAEKAVRGCVRASVLRDRLLSLPGFRAAQKENGLKPILFMRQLFDGRIRIWRENGIFLAAPADSPEEALAEECGTDELAERRNSFYEKAFSNIQKQLSDAGLAKETADEIADIFMHSNSAAEPRKVIHTLLCRRFGPKIGARYYRQAVKYVCV